MSGREAVTDPEEGIVRQPRKPPFKFLVPLVYAPALPLIKIGLRKQPVLRDRLFFGALGAAFLHGLYLVFPDRFGSRSRMIHSKSRSEVSKARCALKSHSPTNWTRICLEHDLDCARLCSRSASSKYGQK